MQDETTKMRSYLQSEEKILSRLDRRPAALKERIFKKLFEESAIAQFTPTELKEYEDSLKAYRDIKNSIDTAREEGLAKGREEGLAEGLAKGREEGIAKGREEGLAKGREEGQKESLLKVAKKLLATGMDPKSIAEMTGLSPHEVELL